MDSTLQKMFSNMALLRELCDVGFSNDLTPFDKLPSLEEICNARTVHLNEVMTGRNGRTKWYNTTKAADRDRLLQAVYEVRSYLNMVTEAAISSNVDRVYQSKDDFDVPFGLGTRDPWSNRRIPRREELERTCMTFRNAKKGKDLAIGRWRDTAHTGTSSTLGILTEYTEGGILDTEIWTQSINNAFLLGVIKSGSPVKLASVLTPRSRKEIESITSSVERRLCDFRDDDTELDGGSLSHRMITWTVQEARTLKLFGYYASPHAQYGVHFLPLDDEQFHNARRRCSVLDIHLIALQTKLLQAIDNITGYSVLQDLIIEFITPVTQDPAPYISLHKRWVANLQASGVPESDQSALLIRRTNLRILQATEKLSQSKQPTETLLLRIAQDVSNSVRYTADRLLNSRYGYAALSDLAINKIEHAHFVLDKLVAKAVWEGKLQEFKLNNYQAIEKFIQVEIHQVLDAPELQKLGAFAWKQYEDFIRAIETGFYKTQKLTGPKFEPDEAPALFSTYLQRLGFRLPYIKSYDFAKEFGDRLLVDFLNNHQYIPYDSQC